MTRRTLLVNTPAELLTLIPYRLGFQPADSIVVAELDLPHPETTDAARDNDDDGDYRGRRTLGAVARAHLPAATTASTTGFDVAPDDVAEALTQWLPARGTRAVLVVVYESTPGAGDGRSFSTAAGLTVAALLARLGTLAIDTLDVVLMGSLRYSSKLTLPAAAGADFSHASGSVADLTSNRMNAEAVVQGLSLQPTRADLAPDTTAVSAGEQAEALAALRATLGAPPSARAAFEEWRQVRQRLQDAQATGCRAQVEAGECGRLLAALSRSRVRDAVLLDALAPGGADRALSALLTSSTGISAGAGGLAAEVDAALARAPEVARAGAVADLAALIARYVGGARAADAYAVAAWTAWNSGRHVHARYLVGAALEHDSANTLARLTSAVLINGMAPAWAAP